MSIENQTDPRSDVDRVRGYLKEQSKLSLDQWLALSNETRAKIIRTARLNWNPSAVAFHKGLPDWTSLNEPADPE